MNKKVKTWMVAVLTLIYGFVFSFFLPILLVICLNKTKTGNNPDGENTAMFFWLLLFMLVIGVMILIIIQIKKYKLKNAFLLFAIFITGAIIGIFAHEGMIRTGYFNQLINILVCPSYIIH